MARFPREFVARLEASTFRALAVRERVSEQGSTRFAPARPLDSCVIRKMGSVPSVPDFVWTTQQSYAGRKKGFWKDTSGVLHSFDDTLNVPNDNPDSSFVQQPAGQKAIFWIDAPGHTYQLPSAGPVDSMTQVQNFTSTVCSTANTSNCFNVNWYFKLVVKPGAVLDTTNSAAGLGSASTNF